MNISALSQDVILAFIRQGLTFAGGLLVTKGLISATQEETIIGAVITLTSVIWSILQKKNANAKLNAVKATLAAKG